MITDLPIYVYLTFAIAVVFSIILFYITSKNDYKFLVGILLWASLQCVLVYVGFYEDTMTVPPRFIIAVIPNLLIVIFTLFSKKTRDWLSTFDLKTLTILHVVRIPVELVLFWLFVGGYVPELMSFSGMNYDILLGITAPLVAILAFRNNRINKSILLGWNIISVLLLTNIIILAIFSTPTALQQFAFDQPNIALMTIPFILLPTIIVPIVLVSNMAGFVILARMKEF